MFIKDYIMEINYIFIKNYIMEINYMPSNR